MIQEAKTHMKRCIDSGLWVPNSNSKTDDGDEKEEEATYEEVKQPQEETKTEWSTMNLWHVFVQMYLPTVLQLQYVYD